MCCFRCDGKNAPPLSTWCKPAMPAPAAIEALRVGRLVALHKHSGSVKDVRALVVGDLLRRLIGQVLAPWLALSSSSKLAHRSRLASAPGPAPIARRER